MTKKLESLEDIIFYQIDKTSRSYRQFAQRRLREEGITLTVDQWLVLKTLQENSEIQQNDLAEKVFKDPASVTRMIDVLVREDYLKRDYHETDGRRSRIVLTSKGKSVLMDIQKPVLRNRKIALKGISQDELQSLNSLLQRIWKNTRA